MIVTALAWIVCTIVFIALGVAFLRLLAFSRLSITLVPLVGLAVLILTLQWLSLMIPLGHPTLWRLTLVICALFFLIDAPFLQQRIASLRQHFAWPPLIVIVAGFTIFFVALLQSSIEPDHPDTGGYHAQAVQWIQQYPAVPGLGNLHDRLAFNSSWFLPSAFFKRTILGNEPIHAINGLLLVLICLFFLQQIMPLFRKKINASAVASLLFLVMIGCSYFYNPYTFFFYPYSVSSPSTELPAALFTFLVIVLMLKFLDLPGAEKKQRRLLLTLITLFASVAVTIKLNATPLLFLPLVIVGQHLFHKNIRIALPLIGIMTGMLVPWAIRNIILSGYLVYPLPVHWLDWFSVDWKIPFSQVKDMADIIKGWAIRTDLPPNQILDGGVRSWFPNWAHGVFRHRLFTTAEYPAALSLMGMLLLRPRIVGIFFKKYFLIVGTIMLGLAFWFLSAPDLMRFGILFLYPFAIMLALPFTMHAGEIIFRRKGTSVILSVIILIPLLIIIRSADFSALSQAIVKNAPYTVPAPVMQTIDHGTIPIRVTTYCWNVPLPCTPIIIGDIELRGPTLADGFRHPLPQ